MSDEIYSFALKDALSEIQEICPDIRSFFMFRRDGQIVAGDKKTSEEVFSSVIDSFNGISGKANALGGVEGVIVEGSEGRADIFPMKDLYLVMVTSRKADMKYVDTVTRVLIPTVLRLLEKIHPSPLKSSAPPMEAETLIAPKRKKRSETPAEKTPKKETPEPETLTSEVEEALDVPETVDTSEVEEALETSEVEEALDVPETVDTSANQLIVENLGGLLIPSDTVRIDGEILSQWKELSEGKKIGEVEVVTFNGKSARCKVKPMKDSKYEGKGVIRVPEKIQLNLDIKKGELVRVKPVFD